ncbi:hypothetical protein T4E_3895 [Trichinella pseudospiralis]|uniref:Uncharacterized protein n=1 Tax=Trichinella pseudospiralis TaxID=6337 RepID=A0A0V0YLR6_TRIPS|nr:hypothetical protein T4E_3895 [Trichinella pseudospiralis]
MGNLKYLGEVVREIIFHDGHLERRFTDAKPTRKERIIGNSMSIPTIQDLLGKYYQFLGQSTTFPGVEIIPGLLSHIILETNR